MIDTAVLLGANTTYAEQEMAKNLQFEVELAMITVPKELRRNMTKRYNPTTTGEAKTYPGLHPSWTTYIRTLLESAEGIVIDDNEKLIINDFEYIKALANLISRTESRVLANYLGWRAARSGETIFLSFHTSTLVEQTFTTFFCLYCVYSFNN